MIEVKVIDDEFVIKGSFTLGIAGTYVNEEFGSDRIQILDTWRKGYRTVLSKLTVTF